ncbi:zinc finger protein OZF-like [Megalobrama amblycephala]|uniref:zinc finger protein OZF-like n=1 Tax=Megalobrama amblycephala TaxID=75352 RepID=UPI002013E408|nr:zinc finger protein OZF-like [Megalobrama amblycephala]
MEFIKEEESEDIKMVFIKEETEDMKIIIKDETEDIKTMFIKDETDNMKIIIKEESEDMKIEETFSVKHEDTEEQTDLMALREASHELNEREEEKEHYNLMSEEKSTEFSLQKGAQKTGTKSCFTCQQCGKSFKHKKHLIDHMSIHTGEKPFTCQQCGQSFRRKGNLKVHMMIHTREKPYTCTLCGNDFKREQSLRQHMIIHTGESPFSCQQCGKSFSDKAKLKIHMRIHTGEKPYTCQQCPGRETRFTTPASGSWTQLHCNGPLDWRDPRISPGLSAIQGGEGGRGSRPRTNAIRRPPRSGHLIVHLREERHQSSSQEGPGKGGGFHTSPALSTARESTAVNSGSASGNATVPEGGSAAESSSPEDSCSPSDAEIDI